MAIKNTQTIMTHLYMPSNTLLWISLFISFMKRYSVIQYSYNNNVSAAGY